MIEGKLDEAGAPLLPSHGSVLATRSRSRSPSGCWRDRDDAGPARAAGARCGRPSRPQRLRPALARLPYFCPGCPHSTSTHVPEGSQGAGRHRLPFHGPVDGPRHQPLHPDGRRGRVLAGRGAVQHPAAHVPERRRRHLLPFRARWRSAPPMASGANITFKILYNDAVAMTGGQKMETGNLDVPAITRLLEAEGVAGDRRRHRRAGASIRSAPASRPACASTTATSSTRCSAGCARSPGVSALVYDQTCAAEKRRRRKRGTFPIPTSAWSSTSWSARAAAIAASPATAWRSSRSRPSSAASAASTSRPATRTSPA